jgi:hypothetical protein
MLERGFHILDFCSQIRRGDDALWQTELLFIRSGSRFAPEPMTDRTNWKASRPVYRGFQKVQQPRSIPSYADAKRPWGLDKGAFEP